MENAPMGTKNDRRFHRSFYYLLRVICMPRNLSFRLAHFFYFRTSAAFAIPAISFSKELTRAAVTVSAAAS